MLPNAQNFNYLPKIFAQIISGEKWVKFWVSEKIAHTYQAAIHPYFARLLQKTNISKMPKIYAQNSGHSTMSQDKSFYPPQDTFFYRPRLIKA